MLGARIQVYWSTKGARGWWDGTILRYDPQRKTFSIRYNTESKDGQSIYEEYLLSPARPQWRLICVCTKKNHCQAKGGSVRSQHIVSLRDMSGPTAETLMKK
jgi:hypothetical protein